MNVCMWEAKGGRKKTGRIGQFFCKPTQVMLLLSLVTIAPSSFNPSPSRPLLICYSIRPWVLSTTMTGVAARVKVQRYDH